MSKVASKVGGGAFQRVRDMIAKKKAAKEAAAMEGQDPAVAEAGAEMAGADPAAGGEGTVPPHGPEAHTGGASPKGGLAGIVKRARPGGGRGLMGNLFSDLRLKENITKTGVSKSGIPIYEFNYISCAERFSGTMAQDLLAINPEAVSIDETGYYKVNYDNIDVDLHLLN
tara:strand:- start:268 stop:777 length:510 start_codon:yes stop_codon:yes gene_type:complete